MKKTLPTNFKRNLFVLAIAGLSQGVSADDHTAVNLETVKVIGQSAQISKALNEQRQSNTIKNVVHSDAIGQMPDDNAAEALQRLPGVSVENDQGEGRFVTVRGLAPELNSVTVNGTLIPSAEADTRAVALDILPSELVQALSVVKSVTPDMDANSLGGTVEVQTLSGFDHDGLFYTVTGEGSHDTNISKTSPKASGAISNVFDVTGGKFAIAAALSWQDRDFGTDNIEADGNWADLDTNSPVLEEFELRDYAVTRERTGLGLNFDYKTNDNASYFLRTQYSEFKDAELRQRAVVNLEDDETERDLKDREVTQTIASFTLGGEKAIGSWTVSAQAGYARSEEETPDYFASTFVNDAATANGFTGTKKPKLNPAANFADASNYVFDELEVTDEKTTDTQKSIKLDLAKDYMWKDYDATFKFGAKYTARDKDNDVQVYEYDVDDSLTLADFSNRKIDYNFGNFGPAISSSAIRGWAANETRELKEGDSLIEDFDMEENIAAAYFMNTVDLDDWTIIAGLRYEHTDFEANGINYDADAEEIVGTINESNNYGNWLPALHARYYVNDDTQIRAAYTQSVVRPTFEALAPSIEAEGTEKATLGDPTLDPLESNNIDLGVEYYMGKSGAFSAFAFYKDIKNFVYKATLEDYGVYDEAETFVNGDSADVYGLELAYTQKFDNGFLLGANLTFSRSDAEISANGSSRDISLPGQSDRVGNLMVGWENDKLSMRVSANYKSSYLSAVGNVEDKLEDVYVDDQTFVDFNASYFFTKNMQVTFEAKNITDEPLYRYVNSEKYNSQYEEYGPSYKLSFTLTNF